MSRLRLGRSLMRLELLEALFEAFDTTGRIYEFLSSGIKGMAVGADGRADIFLRGHGGKRVPAGALGRYFVQLWMEFFFHDFPWKFELKKVGGRMSKKGPAVKRKGWLWGALRRGRLS